MIKRFVSSIRQWLMLGESRGSGKGSGFSATRRGFFTKATIGAASVTGTAGLAKAVVDSMPKPDQSELYRKDALAGEKELMEWEYVEMSEQEKSDMVQSFIDDYNHKS